jgi:hypothetical protein
VQFFTKSFVAQERTALFCREDGMHQNFCERLRDRFRDSTLSGLMICLDVDPA